MRLHEFIEFFARETPASPCVEMGEVSLDYRAANSYCNRMAHAFLDVGMQKGDRLAWLSRNCIEAMLVSYAASKVGVVPTPLNYRLAPPEWAYIIGDSGARVLVVEHEMCAGVDRIRDKLEKVEHFICLGDAPAGWTSFAQWMEGRSGDNPGHQIDAQDDLYQMYTSGTTGMPKGAVLSQRAIESNTRMISLAVNMRVCDTRFLLVMPMYHAGGSIGHQCTVSCGGSVLIHRDFDPVAVVRDLQEKEITNCTLVPAMIQACLVNVPDIAERSFPHLRLMGYGASPIAEETLRQAMAGFGCGFLQVFGMTETTACATLMADHVHRRAVAGEPHLLLSCGRAAPGTRVKIVDEARLEVPIGEIGEIAVSGPQLMKQYWNMPEATADTIENGWLYTGDAALMDEEGFVYIQDRIKDMIVSGGENIYPKEIENALFEHPNVADAAVIGIPDEKFGEAILAFVATRNGEAMELEEMIGFCRERLAGYKVPRKVEFIAEIPRNPSGKILKKDLRKPYWEGIGRRVG
jgi:acyl-CoA synthetase (AMP-forming)/AMP-acid ligase II